MQGSGHPDRGSCLAGPVRVARALSVEHRLDDALYRLAVSHFGPDGLMDIIVLCGIYHTVCAILNGFAIPAPF